MSDRWWTCKHDGIGLPGCPTCDGRFPGPRELSGARNVIAALGSDVTTRDVLLLDDARGWLREARDEIARLTAERDALDSDLGNLLARIFRDGGQRAGELPMDDALQLADETIAAVYAERDALRAAVERVRPVVEGLAVACDELHTLAAWTPRDRSARAGTLLMMVVESIAKPNTWAGAGSALRALLADVPEVAP